MLQAYLDIHAQALFSSLGRLARAPVTSLMTVSVLSIAISLAAGFYLLVANIQQLTGGLEDSNQISLFLKDQVTDDAGVKLAEKIKTFVHVQDAKVITKNQGLAEFREYSGFGDALKALDKNPLPTVIQVMPEHSLEEGPQLDELFKNLTDLQEVDFAQLDMQWVKRLYSIMELADRGVTLLSFILALAVLFITGNTIRLELHNRRDEVIIAKLVGATNRFIQRPFLYTGFWLGFSSGILAWIAVTVMLFILQQPIDRLSGLYDGVFSMRYLSFGEMMSLVAISSLLGVAAAWAVLCYQLRLTKPE
ncbi:permease-like cell division protein FtsX [Methylotuvimicrobium buryatense]|nr:permease-like cell division protein FtsX [Methylotuvimicrobium buryatense]